MSARGIDIDNLRGCRGRDLFRLCPGMNIHIHMIFVPQVQVQLVVVVVVVGEKGHYY